MSIVQEFQTGTVGWEFLYIFIAGCLGDMFAHLLERRTKKWKYPLAQGLEGYYESLSKKLIFHDIGKWKTKYFWAWLQGAIWGGIACIFALLIAKLFLYAKEETENK
jgi:hypothetical protein